MCLSFFQAVFVWIPSLNASGKLSTFRIRDRGLSIWIIVPPANTTASYLIKFPVNADSDDYLGLSFRVLANCFVERAESTSTSSEE